MEKIFYNFVLLFGISCLIGISTCQGNTNALDSECYTANGNDYEGQQSETYVKGSDSSESEHIVSFKCLDWQEVIHEVGLNLTKEEYAKKFPKNYCRNPNNKLFPYCYVKQNEEPEFAYCNIPTCNTPALKGCFKLTVEQGAKAPGKLNITKDVILDGEESLIKDKNMKIGKCLNFCRSRDYDYAGLTQGNSCLCGMEKKDGKRLRDTNNRLKPHDCLKMACKGDDLQGCGDKDAIAVYDTDAGSCKPNPHYGRDSGIIYSPRWPGNYHNEAQCQWTIYIPEKYLKKEVRQFYKLEVSFLYFKLEEKNDTLKFFTYQNETKQETKYLGEFSGTNTPSLSLNVTDLVALHVVLDTDKDDKHPGFIMKYNVRYIGPSTAETPTTTTTATTTTTTPKNSDTASEKPTAEAQEDSSTSSLGGGAIVGIVLGVLIFLAIAVVIVLFGRKFIRIEKSGSDTTTFNNPVSFNSDSPL